MLKKLYHSLGRGPLAMIVAGLFFAGMAALVKKASESIPVFQITFFRAGVSAAIIGAAMYRYGIRLKGGNTPLLITRSLSGFVAMCLNFYALSKIGLGNAALLNQSSPVFVMLLSWLFLGERFHRTLLLLTLASFAGIALLLRPTGEIFNLAGAAAVLSAVFAAGAYVSIRRLHQTDSFWIMAFYFMATSSVLSVPGMLFHWKTPTLAEFWMLVFSGIFGTVGQLLMTYAYKHEEASWVAPFSYTGVLFSFILGVFFFDEKPDLYTLLGGGLTIAAGIAMIRLKSTIRVPFSAIIPPAPQKP